jgi:hypothetical protein
VNERSGMFNGRTSNSAFSSENLEPVFQQL